MITLSQFVLLSALTLKQIDASCLKTMGHKVFVYGTLKRNEPNHHWLTNPSHGVSKFIYEGITKQKYPLVIATRYNIPFLLYSPGKGHHVHGIVLMGKPTVKVVYVEVAECLAHMNWEVYEIDDLMLSNLDILEDHPDYYVREIDEIDVKTECGTEIAKCWVYFLKTFKNDLLQKPMMSNYLSLGDHGLPYAESNNESTKEDLDDVSK